MTIESLLSIVLSHSSILLPVSTKNPMASTGNSRLCRCEIMMTFTPGVKCLPLLPHLCGIYPTQFDIRQIDKSTKHQALLHKSAAFFLPNAASSLFIFSKTSTYILQASSHFLCASNKSSFFGSGPVTVVPCCV